jgi:ATP synthase protein I
VRHKPNDRAQIAGAMSLATTVTTISLEMAVPAALGYWIDRKLGIAPLLTSIGAVLGVFVGIRSLLYLTRPKPPGDQQDHASDRSRN